ncbi:hypothetical protein CSB20_05730 [bacterium DOLZORAL124_64_63]|nr:MAG: hypothetical protein CSB20_05730 [bacterium DOLZORAL124_64_63]
MKISFVIPVYNGARLFPRAVGSILRDGGAGDLEVVLVDDGSTDDSAEVARDLVRRYGDKVVYVHQENKGAAAARNHGVDVSSGEWVWFLDCDDELAEGAVSAFRDFVADDRGLEVVLGGYEVRNGEKVRRKVPRLNGRGRVARVLDYLIHKKLSISQGAFVLRRDVAERIRYSEELGQSEDIPVFVQVLLCEHVAVLERNLAVINRREGSVRNDAVRALEAGPRVADVVFAIPGLPREVMRYRVRYKASRCLSAGRILFRGGMVKEARRVFWAGVRVYPLSLLRGRAVKFVLRAYLTSPARAD